MSTSWIAGAMRPPWRIEMATPRWMPLRGLERSVHPEAVQLRRLRERERHGLQLQRAHQQPLGDGPLLVLAREPFGGALHRHRSRTGSSAGSRAWSGPSPRRSPCASPRSGPRAPAPPAARPPSRHLPSVTAPCGPVPVTLSTSTFSSSARAARAAGDTGLRCARRSGRSSDRRRRRGDLGSCRGSDPGSGRRRALFQRGLLRSLSGLEERRDHRADGHGLARDSAAVRASFHRSRSRPRPRPWRCPPRRRPGRASPRPRASPSIRGACPGPCRRRGKAA